MLEKSSCTVLETEFVHLCEGPVEAHKKYICF